MPAYLSKQKLISYVTSDGVKQSKIVSMAKIGNNLYYRLENGDYAEDTPSGFVKAYLATEMLRSFSDLHGATTWRQ